MEVFPKARNKRRNLIGSAITFTGLLCMLLHCAANSTSSRQLKTKKEKPNIMLLVLDQWRYDWDGMHDSSPLAMPFLRRMAQRGARFTQAYVPAPLCAPARACLATGKEYDFAGVFSNQANSFPLNQVTFYKLLRDRGGYHTMMVGKDDLYQQDPSFPYFPGSPFPPELYDLGFSDARRSVSKTRVLKEVPPFDLYRTYLEQLADVGEEKFRALEIYEDCFRGKMGGNETMCRADTFVMDVYADEFIRNQALDVLAHRPADKPFFVQVNFAGPHPPNFIPATMAQSVQDRNWPPPIDNAAPERWACPIQDTSAASPQYGGRCSYAAELEQLDKYLESVVEQVNLDDTFVCITGDHGEMLGDHNIGGKKVPYQPSVSVPLVCFGGGVPAVAHTYTKPVTTLDLVGTFLELANVAPDPRMMVQSLWKTVTEFVPSPRRVIHSGLGEWRLVVHASEGSESYKLVCCEGRCPHVPAGTPPPPRGSKWHLLLYDADLDPNDLTTLHESRPDIAEKMISTLPRGWCRDYYQKLEE